MFFMDACDFTGFHVNAHYGKKAYYFVHWLLIGTLLLLLFCFTVSSTEGVTATCALVHGYFMKTDSMHLLFNSILSP